MKKFDSTNILFRRNTLKNITTTHQKFSKPHYRACRPHIVKPCGATLAAHRDNLVDYTRNWITRGTWEAREAHYDSHVTLRALLNIAIAQSPRFKRAGRILSVGTKKPLAQDAHTYRHIHTCIHTYTLLASPLFSLRRKRERDTSQGRHLRIMPV